MYNKSTPVIVKGSSFKRMSAVHQQFDSSGAIVF